MYTSSMTCVEVGWCLSDIMVVPMQLSLQVQNREVLPSCQSSKQVLGAGQGALVNVHRVIENDKIVAAKSHMPILLWHDHNWCSPLAHYCSSPGLPPAPVCRALLQLHVLEQLNITCLVA